MIFRRVAIVRLLSIFTDCCNCGIRCYSLVITSPVSIRRKSFLGVSLFLEQNFRPADVNAAAADIVHFFLLTRPLSRSLYDALWIPLFRTPVPQTLVLSINLFDSWESCAV